MARRKQSRGTCEFCGADYAKGGMVRHLRSCPERATANEAADGRKERLVHIRAEDEWSSGYWLDLEVRGSATLKDIDHYLRAIWLECCGHLSDFFAGDAWSRQVAKSRRVSETFGPDRQLTHVYDFGTSSHTILRTMDIREGVPTTRHPIRLMARNHAPETACIVCGKPAAWLCMECLYEDQNSGELCAEHVEGHPHENYGEPIEIVNSPRLGLCGYEGPADPPY